MVGVLFTLLLVAAAVQESAAVKIVEDDARVAQHGLKLVDDYVRRGQIQVDASGLCESCPTPYVKPPKVPAPTHLTAPPAPPPNYLAPSPPQRAQPSVAQNLHSGESSSGQQPDSYYAPPTTTQGYPTRPRPTTTQTYPQPPTTTTTTTRATTTTTTRRPTTTTPVPSRQYVFGERRVLKGCFTNASGYVCCNSDLDKAIRKTYNDMAALPGFDNCNIHRITQKLSKNTQTQFNVTMETMVGLGDYAQKVRFRGDFVCKVEINGRYMMVYGTPSDKYKVRSKRNVLDGDFPPNMITELSL